MSGKGRRESETVKLQIPVSAELAEELAVWAKKSEMTQAKLCKGLLYLAMKDLTNIASWLSVRAVGKRRKGIKKGWLQHSDNSAVRLQVPLPVDLAERIEALALRLNHTQVRMAALILDFALADEVWFLRFMSTRVGKFVTGLFGKKSEDYISAVIPNEPENQ